MGSAKTKKGAGKREPDSADSEEEVETPVYNPHHTDLFFLILFALFWVGMFAIGIYAFTHGDARRLIHGVDMYGNLCGVQNAGFSYSLDLTSKPYLLFPNPFDTSISYCVPACPCQSSSCPAVNPLFPNYAFAFCPYNLNGSTPSPTSILDFVPFGGPCYYWFSTRSAFGRCLPTGATLPVVGNVTINGVQNLNDTANPGTSKIDELRDTSSKVLEGVNNAKYWILMCVFIAFGAAFIWLVLITLMGGCMVWFTILLLLTLLALITIFLGFGWYNYSTLETYAIQRGGYTGFSDSERAGKTTVFVLMWIFAVITLVVLVLVIFFARRIRIAVGLLKEASRAMRSMLSVLLFPIIPAILLALFFAWFIAVWLFLGTAGTYSQNPNGTTTYTTNQTLQGLQIYHIFGLFWTSTFLIGIGEFALGKAFSSWYYAPKTKEGKLKKGLGCVVFRAFRQTVWYHAGSVAFGSFIIAVVKFIKFLTTQLEKRVKAAQMNNRCVSCVFYCVKCCLSYVERFIKFISLNAYIIIGLHGDISFCGAAMLAFKLLLSNALLLATVTVVTDFLLFLGKLFIVSIATAVAVWVMKSDTTIEYWAIPVILVALLSYAIASAFFAVFSMSVNTLFICFCYDVDKHLTGPHMSPRLRKFVDDNALAKKDPAAAPAPKK